MHCFSIRGAWAQDAPASGSEHEADVGKKTTFRLVYAESIRSGRRAM